MAASFPQAPAEAFIEHGPVPSIMVPRSGDLIDRLPEQAASRLRSLRQRAADAATLANAGFAAQEEQRTAKLRHQARIKQLMQPRAANGYNLAADAPQVVAEQLLLDKADAEFKRLSELSDVRAAQRGTLGRIEQAVEKIFSRQPSGTAIAPWEGDAPQLKKGETIFDGIERCRRRLRELSSDLHKIRSSPYPSGEAKALMRAQIEALAERGAPNVLGLIENKTPIEFVTTQIRSKIYNSEPAAVGFSEDLPDALAMVVWLHKDAIVAKLTAEIDACADDKAALTDEQRRAQEATIQSDMLAVEREECALLETALAQGINIQYRDDTSPLAVLGIQLVAASEAPPPATSAKHVTEHVGGR